MTKIKFCGLRRPEDVEAAVQAGADYAGFVFAEGTKRYVSFDKAEELSRLLPQHVKAVGVFLDAPLESVVNCLRSGIIQMAQLHGSEDEEYIAQLRKLTGKPVIKAFRIRSAEDAEAACASGADYILLDSGAGTGRTFEWSAVEKVERPYFLAGGLTPENADRAVKNLHPFALDVSSGIETDGVKDAAKMAAFAAAVRKEDDNDKS